MADTRKVGGERMKPRTRMETDYEMLKRLEGEMEHRGNLRQLTNPQELFGARSRLNPSATVPYTPEQEVSAKRKKRRPTIPTVLGKD